MSEERHQPKLLDGMRGILRRKHYSIHTEEAYVQWARRYILFHGKRHPREMGEKQIEAFLTHLAVHGNVAASTQNQAMNALVFLYRQVLEMELPEKINALRAKKPTGSLSSSPKTRHNVCSGIWTASATQWPFSCMAQGCG